MKYLKFGNLREPISVIGIGCMRIAGMSSDELDRYVRVSLEHGINFFDHADIYASGKSEEIFGDLLSKDPALRNRMFLQSKCAIHDSMYDFSKEYILKSVDGILKRLQTTHLDSLLLHRPDALMEPEEVAEAFHILKDSGKVLNFGVSNMNRFQMEFLENKLSDGLAVNQLQMSIAHTPLIDAGINVNMMSDAAIMRDAGTLEYCRMKDAVIQTWSPLQKGFFGGTFIGSEEYKDLNAALNALAEKYHVTSDAVAYAWLLRFPAKMQVIIGTTNPDRIKNAAKAAEIELTRSEWYELYRAAGNKLP
ncbi:aldo/keto reductase family oxidoreductase [Petralouisia muris]|uniref:Aldo/keto reductase family oxidoreductase n=1 Tax=Petralouisia muris TaxID=3032872 RepID=A0AC61RZ65_9FIRM|nr:aldo/keto reductase [Petralouisia muris]TGY97379.1 aldo/keto reductase family oxidoreductase [Petralouisia muris]